jgi:hypothetical protein
MQLLSIAMSAAGVLTRVSLAQDNVPTSLLVIKPASLKTTNCQPPTDLRSVPESTLQGSHVTTWISLSGYAWFPPIPWNWCAGRTDVSYWSSAALGTNTIVIDDRTLPYAFWAEQAQAQRHDAATTTNDPPPVPGGDDGGGRDPGPGSGPGRDYGSNMWVEILSLTNGYVYVGAHNVLSNYYCQLQYRDEIDTSNLWNPGDIQQNTLATNLLAFAPFPTADPAEFFRAQQALTVVQTVTLQEPALEACNGNPAQDAVITLNLYATVPFDLPVLYALSGSAANGVDYTNLTNYVVIPNGDPFANIYIHPLAHTNMQFDQTVTVTLLPSTNYLIDPAFASSTIFIQDCLPTNLFQVVLDDAPSPIGLDFHAPSTNLVLSVNAPSGQPYNFALLGTNRLLAPWSGVAALGEEIKIATPKANVLGFTNGDLYFQGGTDPVNGWRQIGWLSADGTRSNLNWATLTNETDQVRGGLYVDRTGVIGYDLIVVTGDTSPNPGGSRGVWRVNSSGNSTLLTRIETRHLEGVITLTDDVARWGPWAGKIITGDEVLGRIYAISTNGTVRTFSLGIRPEDFDMIPSSLSNQNLYCAVPDNFVLKVSGSVFTNHASELLITQAAEAGGSAKLFIVNWDANRTNFTTRAVPFGGSFEHVTFAPIDTPTVIP